MSVACPSMQRVMCTAVLTASAAVLLFVAATPCPAAEPCMSWHMVNPAPTGFDLLGTATTAGRWVAVGVRGTIVESPDRVSWEQAPSLTDRTLRSVAALGSRFVAVGDGGEVLISDQSGEWTRVEPPAGDGSDLFGLAAGPGGLVAVGAGGTVLTSPDGLAWAAAGSSEIGAPLYAVTWAGDQYVAVGGNGTVTTSPDGVSWTRQSTPNDRLDLTGVAGTTTMIVATSTGHQTLVSEDGITWSEILLGNKQRTSAGMKETKEEEEELEPQDFPSAVAWCAPHFVAHLGHHTRTYSPDGVVWQDSGTDGRFGDSFAITCEPDGNVLAVGRGGHIAASDDHGKHFYSVNASGIWSLHDATFDSARLLAVASKWQDLYQATSLLYSRDGVVWRELQMLEGPEHLQTMIFWPWRGIVAGAGLVGWDYWEEGRTSNIYTSIDGELWQPVWNGPWVSDITWDGSRYVALLTQSVIGLSEDGTTWQMSEPDGFRALLAVASNQEIVVAVGERIMTTTDGSDWQEILTVSVPGSSSPTLRSVTWGDGRFVAVGNHGVIYTSADGDGVEWSTPVSGTTNDLVRVTWTGRSYVAVGDAGTIVMSSDGTEWQVAAPLTNRDLVDVEPNAYGASAFSADGLMLRSACGTSPGPPTAAFSWFPVEPEAGMTVRFLDRSAGEPTTWQWYMGDGTTADSPVVSHRFTAPGTYLVGLDAGNDQGSSGISHEVKVRRSCASPPAPVLAEPVVIELGYCSISWTDTGVTTYELENSTDPLFLHTRPDCCTLQEGGTAATCYRDWREARTMFFRVRAVTTCDDGDQYSDWSEVRELQVERSFDLPDRYQLVVPVAAHTAGLDQTSWLTDLVIHNPAPTVQPLALSLLHGTGTADTLTELTLRAGHTVRLADVVGTLLPGAEASGAILIDSHLPLVATSRTYNNQPAGTYGQRIGAQPPAAGSSIAGESRLIGLFKTDRYRTNIGVANPYGETLPVSVELFDSGGVPLGSLAATQETVGAWDHLQVTDVFDKLGVGEVVNAYAVISSTTYGTGLLAYASVIDNQSGDAIALTPTTTGSGWGLSQTKTLPGFQEYAYTTLYGWNEVVHGAGTYVARGRNKLASSRDGRSWQVQPSIFLNRIAYNGELFVGVGDGIVSSRDGLSWQEAAWDSSSSLLDVTWTGDQWVAVGRAEVGSSSDGETWTPHEAPVPMLNAVTWTGDRLVAVGDKVIVTSIDGVTWSSQSAGMLLRGVVAAGQVLITWGDGAPGMQRSGDGGDTWQPVEWSSAAVVLAGDTFVTHGVHGQYLGWGSFFTSTDGLEWLEVARTREHAWLDNLSWDGERVISVTPDGQIYWLQPTGQTLTIPVVGRSWGANDSFWRSDLVLHNSAEQALDCWLELLEMNQENSAPRSAQATVAAGGTLRIDDVLGSWFAYTGIAAMRIVPSDQGLHLISRTYTSSEAGTYGQYVPALTDADAIWFSDVGYLTQLSSTRNRETGFRTNLGMLSACDRPMTVEVSLLRDDGELLTTRQYELQPYELQQHGIFEELPLATAVVSTPTSGCSFFAYASVIDNRSNDPVFIPASKVPVATGQPDVRSEVLDNRGNAAVVDQLVGVQGTAKLPAGRLRASVSTSGHLGLPDQPLRVVCLYHNSRGEQQGVSIGAADTAANIAGDGPLWCFIPDWDSCDNNTGWAVVSVTGSEVDLSFQLDAVTSCVALPDLQETLSIPDAASEYQVLATGDLGAAERPVQVLIMVRQQSPYSMVTSQVIGDGGATAFLPRRYSAQAVVLDLDDRSDNTGATQLYPRTEYPGS